MLQARSKNYTNEGLSLAVSQGEICAEALMSFGNSIEGQALSPILKKIGLAQREADNLELHVCNITKEKMVVATQQVIDSDIKKSSELKEKQETARIKYDAAINELKTQQKKGDAIKVQKAEESAQAAKAAYERTTADLTEITQHLLKRVEQEMAAQLKEYAELQLAYFKQGYEVWEKTLRETFNNTSNNPFTGSDTNPFM